MEEVKPPAELQPTKDDLLNGWTKDKFVEYHRKMSEPRQEKPKLPRTQVKYNIFRRNSHE